MTSAYLDTSAWSELHDAQIPRSRFERVEVLFSSCNLDEIGISPSVHRASDLANYAWRISNRLKLRDHLELTAAEYAAEAGAGSEVTICDAEDPSFAEVWNAVRRSTIPENLRQAMASVVTQTKRQFRDWLNNVRQEFAQRRGPLSEDELGSEWPNMLRELEDEGWIDSMIHGLLHSAGLGATFRSGISYRSLPATASWVQYYLALAFRAAHASRKSGRPDLGDQVDFRHACYAGIADYFVSGDAGMRDILSAMVFQKTATILSPSQFMEVL